MVTTARQKKSSNSTESPSNKKDFSKLYKKKEGLRTIPVNVPSMGLDLELEYTPPTEEIEVLFDRYIVAVAKATDEAGSDRSDEEWLNLGKRQVLDLGIYIKRLATKERAEKIQQETATVKTPELIELRDRMKTALVELESVIEPKYDEYEKFSHHMLKDEALDILHNCIALCLKEIEEPEQLQDQIKYYLALGLLSISGRIPAI